MSNNNTVIDKNIPFYDLLNLNLITSKETLLTEMIHARRNINAINEYLLACTHKLAKLTNQKIFSHECIYDTVYLDFYVGKDINDINVGSDSIYSEVLEYNDGNWDENSLKEVADYTIKSSE